MEGEGEGGRKGEMRRERERRVGAREERRDGREGWMEIR